MPAEATGTPSSAVDTSHCQAIAAGDARMAPLAAVCEFALRFRGALPDFVCEQTTTSTGLQATTVVKAEVTFENGHERYSNVTINGKPSAFSPGGINFISAGELGTDLVDLFTAPIAARFHFVKEEKLKDVPALLYAFQIPAEKNTFWALRDYRGTILHPEYEGKLWLQPLSGYILKLELHPTHMPKTFQIASAAVTIDYSEVPILGLSTFLLPSTSSTGVCNWQGASGPFTFSCAKNVLVFHDCRKFAAKTRILTPP